METWCTYGTYGAGIAARHLSGPGTCPSIQPSSTRDGHANPQFRVAFLVTGTARTFQFTAWTLDQRMIAGFGEGAKRSVLLHLTLDDQGAKKQATYDLLQRVPFKFHRGWARSWRICRVPFKFYSRARSFISSTGM